MKSPNYIFLLTTATVGTLMTYLPIVSSVSRHSRSAEYQQQFFEFYTAPSEMSIAANASSIVQNDSLSSALTFAK